MDLEKLVFIDETWASTNLTRNYGRAPKGLPMRGFGTARRLENDDLCSRLAPPSIDRPDGRRRAHGWRNVSGLGRAVLMPHLEAGGYRHPRQSQQPQGGRGQTRDRKSTRLNSSHLG